MTCKTDRSRERLAKTKNGGKTNGAGNGKRQDGLPKGKNNISRQTENMALNIPDYVSGEIREYEAKVQQLQDLKAQILQEVSRLKLKEKRIIFDFYMHNLKWEQVAVRNSYSERQCKNIRDTALETLSQRFEKNQIISQFQRIA